MINIYQIHRKKNPKEVVFVGSFGDCESNMRQAHSIVGSSIFEISEASLEALAMRDSLSKKAIFAFKDDVGHVRTIYSLNQPPKTIGQYPPTSRDMEDYYGDGWKDFDTGNGLLLPSNFEQKPQISTKDKVKEYLAKFKNTVAETKPKNKNKKKGKK